jgi:hypothetical protein
MGTTHPTQARYAARRSECADAEADGSPAMARQPIRLKPIDLVVGVGPRRGSGAIGPARGEALRIIDPVGSTARFT